MRKVKQGQTRWKTVVYDPGKIEGYDDCYVAIVYSCRVTKVVGNSVYFSSENGPYIAHINWWHKKHKTFRKAMAEGRRLIERIEKGY